jgi:glycerate 2-kinase
MVNSPADPTQAAVAQAKAFWWAGVNAVQPLPLLTHWWAQQPTPWPNRLYMLAVGKAASAMAAAVATLGPIAGGLVVAKQGHAMPVPGCTTLTAEHPIPGPGSVAAALAVAQFAQARTTGDTVWVLLSGGASALLADLPPHISLADWQTRTQRMLAKGLPIHAINAQRKRIGTLKGGKLLQLLQPATVQTLAISDVTDNDPGTIGSGLTVPVAVNPVDVSATYTLVGHAAMAVQAVCHAARQQGWLCHTPTQPMQADVTTESQRMVAVLSTPVTQPTLTVWWGEPTMMLPENPGLGGRNQHLALSVAYAMATLEWANPQKAETTSPTSPWVLLAAGSDGTDGPTEAAGGWVTHANTNPSHTMAITAIKQALQHANSGHWLTQHQQQWVTGPTQTNVMDLVLALQWPPGE